uniref:2-phosphosulfolactate phosphatase n=1 Tax=Aureoumbra lagunensis TaxID=44058 RepID=A0A7S3K007_9STRA|mmetsp:Transcript_12999/g.17405  ORF Transcript_12999/g.17405 Transcript_12999/m.17405 type:complete len:313 (-) Transcript_12999:67-1005(-)|eukprot:CAMPEP_0197287278 /NCGR_PEP_ID=MMETSP0890-20130614/3497_1 /TAXON_ID=44058 ORGANISM="Aureoumbra lagunensis, Strain CCMP1510" /NCGR_SAMPLE_ID=MMETSP0890 /ASSEMBLY_ACC=CAM_ASM_000533 /LENGTH=312 /DNA_ID=CAMNT_0042756739 /DNA_START=120 /DNA_END=1058 /DNA_ORIENTATION=+
MLSRSVFTRRIVLNGPSRKLSTFVQIAPLPSEVSQVPNVAVLIDIQRATSTLTTAFAHGLYEARIYAHIEEVRSRAEKMKQEEDGDDVLLGGERNFIKIDGFDLDNSPRAYADEQLIAGKSLLFTSTNGARALAVLPKTTTVILGCFLNQRATRHFCQSCRSDLLLLCSGTHGERSDEDELFAGALASYLVEHCGYSYADNTTRDIAQVADHAAAFPLAWNKIMSESNNAKGLLVNGLAADIEFVKQIDLYPNILPMRPSSYSVIGSTGDEKQQLKFLDGDMSTPDDIVATDDDSYEEFLSDPPFIRRIGVY